MTVHKRLFWSNILMIFVPVIATALIGLLCVGVIWLSFINGMGMGMHDQEDFNRVCMAVTEAIEHRLESRTDLSSMNAMLEGNGITVMVLCGEETVYSYGQSDENDTALIFAAEVLDEQASISQNGRNLYKASESADGKDYTIYLFGGNHSQGSYANLKAAFVTSVILIAFTIFGSVLLTNRFLIKFVFRRIEEPLDILTSGVHEIRDGNLEYRIEYRDNDEFLPVCEDFNEMAVRLKDSVAKIQLQEKSRRELIAGISHDIRSPLTSIQAYVEGLLDGIAVTPEMQRSYLTTIKNKALDLDHIVSQLFLFSKMELGEVSGNVCKIQLDEKICSIVLEAEAEYAEKGLEVKMDLAPTVINADPVQIERIVTNILGNSLKYKEKENVKVRITLSNTGNGCRLSFADDGPGVPEESLPHLFEVFYRSDPARKNPQGGSGLGLAIVKSIIDHMNGNITAVRSDMGGLEIRINLPCEEV